MSAADIKIIDVIAKRSPHGGSTHYYVVVDRMPSRIYERAGINLTAHDGGFYDFLGISPGSSGAFGGRKFDVKLTDGSTYQCHGQVWACGAPAGIEPVVQVGVSTIDDLHSCYVFMGGYVSAAKLHAWLESNKPSGNYYKYDPRATIEYLDRIYAENACWDRVVSPKRARKLRHRGVTIRRRADGAVGWSPSYERKKAAIAAQEEA